MSDEPPFRRPAAFPVEPPAAPTLEAAPRPPRAVPDLSALAFDPEDAVERAELEAFGALPPPRPRRGLPFGRLFTAALGALVSVAIGLAIDDLVRSLFTRADWLGWTALALAGLLLLGALGVIAREARGLLSLKALERERVAAARAYAADSSAEAPRVVADLAAFLSARPETAEGRARMAALSDAVIDGRDLIALAEREMLTPLDASARALVLSSARRVSVVTAVSPKAIVDIGYVLYENLRLVRRMAELYGARPGAIGLAKLVRDVVGHLAVTGSIAVGDSVVGQVVGHGLAARLSARLGEGLVNGLLTARVGLAAMDLCRPMPFLSLRRPRIADFMADLARQPGAAVRSDRGAESSAESV